MNSSRLLGEFLRARRQAITPEWASLPDAGFRRTPGLRREEVAVLAGISTDYYTRLEQGRERHPSEQLLQSLARVLNLGSDATAHLYELAYPERRQSPGGGADLDQVSPTLLRLIDSRPFPAVVCNRRQDVLACNRPFAALLAGFRRFDNLLRVVFLDPAGRTFFRDWEAVARARVANLRAVAGADLAAPHMVALVTELSRRSEDFARLWACHEVIENTGTIRRMRHPEVGDLTFAYEVFSPNGSDGQRLIMLHPEPGSVTERRLALLDPSGGRPGPTEPEPAVRRS